MGSKLAWASSGLRERSSQSLEKFWSKDENATGGREKSQKKQLGKTKQKKELGNGVPWWPSS